MRLVRNGNTVKLVGGTGLDYWVATSNEWGGTYTWMTVYTVSEHIGNGDYKTRTRRKWVTSFTYGKGGTGKGTSWSVQYDGYIVIRDYYGNSRKFYY